MAIKKTVLLTKEDFESALVELRLSVSEVARETGLPRQYISHFRSYGDGLRPEQVAKVRDFIEARLAENGMTLESERDTDTTKPEPMAPALPKPDSASLRSTSITCIHFATSPAIQSADLMKIVRDMESNEARLEELMGKEAKEAGLFESGEWSAETAADMQEAIGLMASNFVLFSLAQGKSFVYRDTDEGEDVRTVRDVMNDTFATAFTGVIGGMVNTRPTKKQGQPASDTQGEKAWL
jgi:hypothetical protein